MKKFFVLGLGLLFLSFMIVSSPSAGQKIAVGGTGDSQELLRAVAGALEKDLKGAKIEVPDSVGSGGGIKLLAAGKIDLARVARPLKEKEKKFGLTYRLFARSPVVFVINPSVTGIENITTKEVIGIYAGRITDWSKLGGKKGKIYPVTREPGDSNLSVLEENLPRFSDIKEVKAKIIYNTPETVQTLADHKNTIGFIPLAMTKGSGLKILKLDGIYPSAENVKNGRYRLVTLFGIVYKGKLNGLARKFVDFLYSDKGKAIIIKNGAIPAR
jgi:phosphate transport system substrate-binding protein